MRFDSVPTQGEIFDWHLSVRTLCGEPCTIPPVAFTLTAAEALAFIQLHSEACPDLNVLYGMHLKTVAADVLQ